MPKMYWLRISMMAFILIGVIVAMNFLNSTRPGSHARTAHFLKQDTDSLSLCPSRVAWVETVNGGPHIEQKQGTWVSVHAGEKKELDQIAVEKWLSHLCTAHPNEVSADASSLSGFKPIALIGYVTGKTMLLLQGQGGGSYRIAHRKFVSPELDEALRSLPTLPTSAAPGTK